jgi:molecular chaperone GrpE
MTDRDTADPGAGDDVEAPAADNGHEGNTDPHAGAQPRDSAAATLDAGAQVAEQREKYLRLAAEFDNFRKRVARDREQAEHIGQSIVIRGLLDGLDDLARFAHLDPARTDVGTVIDGAAMVEQKLLKSLAGHGLEVVNPQGRAFDPKVHEAVATAPAESKELDHTVAQVYQVGYVLNGQLLRPARVVVKQWAG